MTMKFNIRKITTSITLHGLTFNPRERLIKFANGLGITKDENITFEIAQKWAEYEGLIGLKILVEDATKSDK